MAVARQRYLEAIRERGVGAYVSNAPGAEMHIHTAADAPVPVVRVPGNTAAAAFFSPLTRLLAYPLFTIGRQSGAVVRGACATLSRLSCDSLRSVGLDRVAYVNHWIHPAAPRLQLSQRDLNILLDELLDAGPEDALVFEHLVPVFDSELIDSLLERGALAIPVSTSWIADPSAQFSGAKGRSIRKTRRQDRARGEALSSMRVSEPSMVADRHEELRVLYKRVYLERHPAHLNMQFTPAFFELFWKSGVWDVHAWSDDRRLLAFTSFLRDHRCIASGAFGLDTQLPKSLGLFRAIISLEIQASVEAGLPLDLGAGNDRFKKLRGLRPHQDYMLVLNDHLPARKRAIWQAIARARARFRASSGAVTYRRGG